ncbi:MAG: sensor domain-containing diguanylate cyclase [Treponema sp.]|nr:sensor domain-containing diguanylate cyclase [Treponema sp.]
METQIKTKKNKGLSSLALLAFFGTVAVCTILSSVIIINGLKIERLQTEQLILEKAYRINVVISKLLYKTNSLSALVIHGNGNVDDFDRIAPLIADDPAVFNVIVAPNGIVSNVYPLTDGNDAVIGWDYFSEAAGNLEAIFAMDSMDLVLAGPFISAQGSKILTGRLPVYIETPDGKNEFWGLVSVGLNFPLALDDVELDIFKNMGFYYELWRINPDTNERQIIAGFFDHKSNKNNYIEKHIPLFNADWYLRVWPIPVWYTYPQNLIIIISGLIISLLVLFVMQNNHELKQIKSTLENIARTDSLTGIYNRRHFMEESQINIERLKRSNLNDSYIILFDLDRFKNINDTFGHNTGDKVLTETAIRIKALIRPYDLFARYGGEEFVIFASKIEKDNVIEMVERLRLCLCENVFTFDNVSLNVSASFGIAFLENYDLKKTIHNADEALYTAKRSGRNMAVFNDKS